MNTTIGELELYEAKINKFSKFIPVRDLPEEERTKLVVNIKDSIAQCDDHLNNPNVHMPDKFRNEWVERRARCEKWLKEGANSLYLEESEVQVPVSNGKEKKIVPVKVTHLISFTEA